MDNLKKGAIIGAVWSVFGIITLLDVGDARGSILKELFFGIVFFPIYIATPVLNAIGSANPLIFLPQLVITLAALGALIGAGICYAYEKLKVSK